MSASGRRADQGPAGYRGRLPDPELPSSTNCIAMHHAASTIAWHAVTASGQTTTTTAALKRDELSLNHHRALAPCLRMIFSEKPLRTFPDHAPGHSCGVADSRAWIGAAVWTE